MRALGLATKITVPFVVLFMALLAGLGLVLAREIFQEIEARVVREQTFVLTVASDPRLPVSQAFLRKIRSESGGGAELLMRMERGLPITTLDLRETADRELYDAILKGANDARKFPGMNDPDSIGQILSARLTLAGERYLVFYTRAPAKGGGWRDSFLVYPQANIQAVQQRAVWRIAGFAALGLFLAALIGRVVAHWIARPVARLAAAAGKIASGGLDEPFEPALEAARDEIGELSRAFARMVESLRASQKELVKAERLAATGKLAASVAHEIRNPLTSLRMTIQMLAEKDDKAGGSDREAYQIVVGEIDRLALAVEELLTFARPRPPQRTATDLNKLSADTLQFLARQLEHARIEARLEPDEALPGDLAVDPNKIRQLLVNLILNAMQAIVRDGKIVLRTRWDPGASRAVLEVRDTGPGIPEDLHGKLFDPFVSTKPGGGGLGLAIAKQVVEEHGGAIRFESAKTGTAFIVELPAEAKVAAAVRTE